VLAATLCWGCGGGGEPAPEPEPTGAPVVEARLLAHDGSEGDEPGAQTFLPGDTLRLRAIASAEGGLGFLGYRIAVSGLGTFADSLLVPDENAADTLLLGTVLVPAEGFAGEVAFTAFARDRAGRLAERPVSASPATVVRASGLYGSAFSTTPVDQVGELRAAADTVWVGGGFLVVGERVGGLDFLSAGDSLVFTAPQRDAYGVLGIAFGVAPSPRFIPDTVTVVEGRPVGIRVLAGDIAIATRRPTAGGTWSMVRLDLRTGAQTLLPAGPAQWITRSDDRRFAFMLDTATCCPGRVRQYDVTTGQTGGVLTLPADRPRALSFFGDAARLLAGDELYQLPSLARIGTYRLHGTGGAIVEPGTQRLLSPTRRGVLASRLADGVGLELWMTPVPAVALRWVGGMNSELIFVDGTGRWYLMRAPRAELAGVRAAVPSARPSVSHVLGPVRPLSGASPR
jgi:hypothetical protein